MAVVFIMTMTMTITIAKKDFQGYAFSDSYIKWIQENAEAIKSINENGIIIEADNEQDCFRALIFLGYAWGQQDNGR